MSFEDDAIEPLAVESAEHFTKLVRRTVDRVDPGGPFESNEPSRDWREPRRALPRELGN